MLSFLPHVGMRITKTVVAIFVCYLFGLIWPDTVITSSIAAIICLRPDPSESIEMGAIRIFGTLFGGITGVLTVILTRNIGIYHGSFLYGVVACLTIILLIKVLTSVDYAAGVVITCIVFVGIVFTNHPIEELYSSAGVRMGATLIGVIVAVLINYMLPNNRAEQKDN